MKAKALLGTAYKVATEPRETFLRAMLLFDMCGFWMSVLQESASSSRGDYPTIAAVITSFLENVIFVKTECLDSYWRSFSISFISPGGNELFKILLVNTGKLVYPTYVVSRRAEVFQDRQDLVDWQDAVLVEQVA